MAEIPKSKPTTTTSELVEGWRKELQSNLKEMYEFKDLGDPHEILKILSGFSARARYICGLASTSNNRSIRDFKFEEATPFLQECEYQRQIWSRVGTLIKDEWDMTRG